LGHTVAEVAEAQDVTVVCYNCGRTFTIEPDPATILQAGDNLFIFTTVQRLMPLIEYGLASSSPPPGCEGPILVCGLGHTGYRIVTNLLELGRQVTALDFEASRLSARLDELGVPPKYGDLRWNSTLIEAGIEQAAAIEELLFGRLANGGHVRITVNSDDALTLNSEPLLKELEHLPD
jgi:Trk K+ transport system NAD-binding subunit